MKQCQLWQSAGVKQYVGDAHRHNTEASAYLQLASHAFKFALCRHWLRLRLATMCAATLHQLRYHKQAESSRVTPSQLAAQCVMTLCFTHCHGSTAYSMNTGATETDTKAHRVIVQVTIHLQRLRTRSHPCSLEFKPHHERNRHTCTWKHSNKHMTAARLQASASTSYQLNDAEGVDNWVAIVGGRGKHTWAFGYRLSSRMQRSNGNGASCSTRTTAMVSSSPAASRAASSS